RGTSDTVTALFCVRVMKLTGPLATPMCDTDDQRATRNGSDSRVRCRGWFGGLLLLVPLPPLLDPQPVAEFPLVVPLGPLDLALERLGLPLDQVEVGADTVLRGFFVRLALERVAPARGPRHLPVLVVHRPHELRRCDVLDHRGSLRELELLAPVLGGDQLPGADQLVLGLRALRIVRPDWCGRNSKRDDHRQTASCDCRHEITLHRGIRFNTDPRRRTTPPTGPPA